MIESKIGFGRPWLFLTAALGLHVLDEAVTGFLPVYNATVLALSEQYLRTWGRFPAPTFTRNQFLFLMITTVALCFAVTPFAARGARWMRPLAWFAVVIQFLNAMGHTLGTILGHTVASVTFPRPAPGFYSSPLLFIGSVWLAVRLRKTASGSRLPASGNS
jgi:hypothetical protein